MSKVCVLGPSGKMGRELIRLIDEDTRGSMALFAAVDRPGSEILGKPLIGSGVVPVDDIAAGLAEADVYIDFTAPEATIQAAQIARERGIAAVIGTTGLGPDGEAAVAALSERVPVVYAANFSLGVNVLLGLAERAAAALGEDFDIEIVEFHHKHKRDAPSGTALALAEALRRGRGDTLEYRLAREGDVGPRGKDELGVLAVRGGDVVGEHTAYFFGDKERLELTHRAGSRSIFAAGALRAASWVVGKPAGRYTMRDVLGL